MSYEYDELGRVTKRKYNTNAASARYTYQAGKNSGTTTNLISQIQNDWGETLSYTYDSMGNILTLSIDGNLAEKYTYDLDGTLIEVYQKWRDTVYTYDYDDRGNILSTKEYYCTNGENKYLRTMSGGTYDYNWKDLLTSYDGSVITYDEIGNPLTYRDSMTMSWEGRRLSSINNGAINYEYDSSGIRSKKTVDGNATVFYNIGGVKAGEYRDDGIDILYLYDDKGKIYGISVNEQIYYFMENIQGDVIGLYDYYGRVCARYTYDPWGNIIGVQELDTVTFGEDNKKIGEVNPFRYRGYYYDMETGFYYLNSRYYDPQVKRFINADAYASTGQGFNGTNMFCYCWNNPVNKVDKTGHMAAEAATAATNWWNPLGWIAAGILLVEVVATVYVCNTISNSSSRGYYGPSNPYIGNSSGSGSSYAANPPSYYAASNSSVNYYAESQRIAEERNRRPYDRHHIVPKAAAQTLDARLKVEKYIDINDYINIVDLPCTFHWKLHGQYRNSYYSHVNEIIGLAGDDEYEIMGALMFLRMELLTAAETGIILWEQ